MFSAPPDYLPEWYRHTHRDDSEHHKNSKENTHASHLSFDERKTDDAPSVSHPNVGSGFFSQAFLTKFALHVVSVAVSLLILVLAIFLLVKGIIFKL
jgi:hypothetical protein